MDIRLRKGTDTDAELIIGYIKKLAAYENLDDDCNITIDSLKKLMKEENGLNAVIAYADGVPAGMMLYYFYKIATFSGKRVMYIEDIYIDEQFRRYGIGSILFGNARHTAAENNCSRLEWKCLDWNTSAQAFYQKIGGKLSSDEWLTYTIDKNNF